MEDKVTGVNKYELTHRTKKEIMINNFIGGLTWSFGAFLGLILVGLVAGIIISKINLVPVIGNWLSQILNHAAQNLRTPIQQ
ncbi:MAG: DUF5665 domain-containing protein [Candidatus Curtissbacteria bacterium]|nr:DUF5665 domain-containing protein [Candidatus Curtissbacteria bacterium]